LQRRYIFGVGGVGVGGAEEGESEAESALLAKRGDPERVEGDNDIDVGLEAHF
jgi:hypothetical protein